MQPKERLSKNSIAWRKWINKIYLETNNPISQYYQLCKYYLYFYQLSCRWECPQDGRRGGSGGGIRTVWGWPELYGRTKTVWWARTVWLGQHCVGWPELSGGTRTEWWDQNCVVGPAHCGWTRTVSWDQNSGETRTLVGPELSGRIKTVWWDQNCVVGPELCAWTRTVWWDQNWAQDIIVAAAESGVVTSLSRTPYFHYSARESCGGATPNPIRLNLSTLGKRIRWENWYKLDNSYSLGAVCLVSWLPRGNWDHS